MSAHQSPEMGRKREAEVGVSQPLSKKVCVRFGARSMPSQIIRQCPPAGAWHGAAGFARWATGSGVETPHPASRPLQCDVLQGEACWSHIASELFLLEQHACDTMPLPRRDCKPWQLMAGSGSQSLRGQVRPGSTALAAGAASSTPRCRMQCDVAGQDPRLPCCFLGMHDVCLPASRQNASAGARAQKHCPCPALTWLCRRSGAFAGVLCTARKAPC